MFANMQINGKQATNSSQTPRWRRIVKTTFETLLIKIVFLENPVNDPFIIVDQRGIWNDGKLFPRLLQTIEQMKFHSRMNFVSNILIE